MYKLKMGSLRTVVYNKSDLDLYYKAGWTLVEDKKEELKKSKKTDKVQKEKVNEQNDTNIDIIEK